MKKMIGYFSLVLLLSLAIGIGYAWIFRVEVATKVLSNALNMRVEMSDLNIEWNKVTFQNLKIQDTQNETSFSAASFSIDFLFSELFGNPLTIEKIKIQNGELRIKMLPLDMDNLKELGSKVTDLKSLSTAWSTFRNPFKDKKVATQEKKGRAYLIKNLTATQFQVQIEDSWWNGKNLQFPLLELRDLNSGDSMGLRAMTQIFFQAVMTKVVEQKKEGFSIPLPFQKKNNAKKK